MSDKRLVLFAEDDNEDWMLIDDTLQQCSGDCIFERVRDGVELLNRLRDPNLDLPDVIMMDLKMPKKDGIETLTDIRQDDNLKHIPIIIMTTSKTETDIMKSYISGVNSYVVKPVTFEDMNSVLTDIHHYWGKVAVIPKLASNA